MAIKINKLTNANLYIDGNNYLGRAEEITLPEVKQIMADHKGLGLAGVMEFWAGAIEKMEAKIKWGSYYSDAFSKLANPTVARQIMVRGSLASHDASGLTGSSPYVCYFTGVCKNFPMGSFKHADNAEFESQIAVYTVKLEVGGVEKLFIDVPNNIYRVDGVDILAKFRADIGA